MNADTSSSWLENQFDEEPWPGPNHEPTWDDFRNVFIQTGRQFGKNLQLVQGAFTPAVQSVGTHIHGIMQAYVEAGKSVVKAAQSTAAFNTEVTKSRYRENEAHWQAPHPLAFHFDRRGRKLY